MAPLAVCRFFHFMAAMLAFGSSAYLRLHAPDDLRRALSPGIRGLAIATGLVALVTACVWLSLEAASMANDPSAATDLGAIETVLADTAFGRAWILHLGLAAALVVAVVSSRPVSWTSITVLSGLLLASLGLVGHAAMQSGAVGVLHRANHAVHLLAAGAWIGGLIPFVMCVDAYAHDRHRRAAVTAMMRFSFSGHFVVAAIIATGIVNIALTAGYAPLPPSTPYRALLDVKIGLVAIMVALAVVNRYIVVPQIRASPGALTALRAITIVNVGLGTLVVALVSVFALLDPR